MTPNNEFYPLIVDELREEYNDEEIKDMLEKATIIIGDKQVEVIYDNGVKDTWDILKVTMLNHRKNTIP